MNYSIVKEAIYDNAISELLKKAKIERFFEIVEETFLEEGVNEIKIPMQLLELSFDFDFHREVRHPISSNIKRKFKSMGYRITKVRNNYIARIRKRNEQVSKKKK